MRVGQVQGVGRLGPALGVRRPEVAQPVVEGRAASAGEPVTPAVAVAPVEVRA